MVLGYTISLAWRVSSLTFGSLVGKLYDEEILSRLSENDCDARFVNSDDVLRSSTKLATSTTHTQNDFSKTDISASSNYTKRPLSIASTLYLHVDNEGVQFAIQKDDLLNNGTV